jgi:NAD(P)-dependent dehydrogenase (short-subunit alcohol dehydrogenase family)
MRIDLSGSTALVTGGARGIGLASARRLADAGARVVLVDRRIDDARIAASEFGATAYELDISDEEGVESTIGRIEEADGPLDILVNCAGNLQNTVPPQELPQNIWDRIVGTHLRGTYMVTRAVGLRMCARGRGAIVTIASVTGMRSAPLHAYAPAKAALINQVECLAAEWGAKGVRINSLSPGTVATPGVQRGFEEHVLDPDLMRRHSALRRLVAAEEIADGVLFLASPMASAVTGINLPVDAGWLVGGSWASYGGLRD